MKKISYLILIVIILSGCENKEEQSKNNYIAYKNNLLEIDHYTKSIPLDIIVNLERKDNQTVDYQVLFQNPKENMHKIKAMVVNNYSNENIFPTIGLFDEAEELLINSQEKNKLELSGTIETTKNISDLKLNLKVWIEYQNDAGEKKEIYYQV